MEDRRRPGDLVVARVPTAVTTPLRDRVLRPGRPPDPATWAALDVAGAATFAVLAPDAAAAVPARATSGGGGPVPRPEVEPEPIATVTVFPADHPDRPEVTAAWQLRGMATAEGWQGRGVGRLALAAAVAHVTAEGATVLWCNARLVAVAFYAGAGFTVDGPGFDVPGIGPHHRMSRSLAVAPIPAG